MNLEDVIDSEYGLQQDEWSLSKPTFGEEGQLEVVGWSGRSSSGAKCYVLKCNNCSQDYELFGEGVFKSIKSNIVNKCHIPCGCTRTPRWSKEQFSVICTRKAEELGYKFLSFVGEWKGANTKIKMLCEKHGEWDSSSINNLNNHSYGCSRCNMSSKFPSAKADVEIIQSFIDSGAFHPDTEFWRSDRVRSRNKRDFWFMFCPECGQQGEAQITHLQLGQRPCACSPMRQQECYINQLIDDCNNTVGIKFGVANNSEKRLNQQNRHSAYTLKQHSVYTFPSVQQCKQAERECKKELETGVVLKRDMPDGYSETTWAYNIGRVKDIYERNGGVLVE